MAEWVKREYGKGVIDRAGALLVPWWSSGAQIDGIALGSAYLTIQNWRTSHAFPLNTFQMGLRVRARRVEAGAIVAQRLKRFSSVMNKLTREPIMKLSQMHDLGGCRAILGNVGAVDRLFDLYRGSGPGLFSESESSIKCYDYIRNPKPDGYRGIHVVGRYLATAISREAWNGCRIEIQLRSRLQHAFATAVETVTTFTNSPLKFGGGHDQWRRFFSLMGSAIAIREGTSLVSDTPSRTKDLVAELKDVTRALRVRQRLRGWTKALTQLPKRNTNKAKWLLLVLDVSANTIQATGYSDSQEAFREYAQVEKSGLSSQSLDAVLARLRLKPTRCKQSFQGE